MRTILLILLLVVLCPIYAAEEESSTDFLITKLISPTPLMNDLQHLADHIGGRPTGSAALDQAMQWSVQRFLQAGLENVHLETYQAPLNWLAHKEKGWISSDKNKDKQIPLRLAAMPFTASTPAKGLAAPVFFLNEDNPQEIAAHATEIKNHWVLVASKAMHNMDDLFNDYLITPPLLAAAQKAEAVGLLMQSNRPDGLLYRHNPSANGKAYAMPAAIVEREGSEKIKRMLDAGEQVILKAQITNIFQENPRNANVVAEIKGYEKPDEIIILGAHLDSWDLGQGALDNGCNAVMVLDVARQIAALQKQGFKPRRTIRFMLYSGEELAFYGSWFDVKNHPENLDNIKAVIIYDLGAGRTNGFSLGGRQDMVNLVNQALAPISALGPFQQTTNAFIGTDNFDYLLKGIPTLVANQEETPYLTPYHAATDSIDKIDPRELKLNSVIAAVLTWNLANTSAEFPKRQDKVTVTQLLANTGLKKQMEIYNLWDDFIQNKRT